MIEGATSENVWRGQVIGDEPLVWLEALAGAILWAFKTPARTRLPTPRNGHAGAKSVRQPLGAVGELAAGVAGWLEGVEAGEFSFRG